MSNDPEGVIITPEFRMLFPNLFEARAVMLEGKPTGDPKFGLTMLFSPEVSEGITVLKQKALTVARAKWPARDFKENSIRFPFKNGDAAAAEQAKRSRDGSFYVGMVVLKSSSKFRPQVVDRTGAEIMDASRLYSGCYGHAEVNFVAYSGVAGGQDGVTAYVNFVMKTRDGDRIAARQATDVFADIIGKDTGEDPTAGNLDDKIPF